MRCLNIEFNLALAFGKVENNKNDIPGLFVRSVQSTH
jgi:hypothetical protein